MSNITISASLLVVVVLLIFVLHSSFDGEPRKLITIGGIVKDMEIPPNRGELFVLYETHSPLQGHLAKITLGPRARIVKEAIIADGAKIFAFSADSSKAYVLEHPSVPLLGSSFPAKRVYMFDTRSLTQLGDGEVCDPDGAEDMVLDFRNRLYVLCGRDPQNGRYTIEIRDTNVVTLLQKLTVESIIESHPRFVGGVDAIHVSDGTNTFRLHPKAEPIVQTDTGLRPWVLADVGTSSKYIYLLLRSLSEAHSLVITLNSHDLSEVTRRSLPGQYYRLTATEGELLAIGGSKPELLLVSGLPSDNIDIRMLPGRPESIAWSEYLRRLYIAMAVPISPVGTNTQIWSLPL